MSFLHIKFLIASFKNDSMHKWVNSKNFAESAALQADVCALLSVIRDTTKCGAGRICGRHAIGQF